MKRVFYIISTVFAAVFVSCNKDISEPDSEPVSAGIGVNVLDFDGILTKSGSDEGELFDSFVIDSIGDKVIRLDAYVSDINPLSCSGEAQTKGAIVTSSLLNNNVKTFKMDAYAHDEWYDNTLPDGTQGSITDMNPAGIYFAQTVTKNDSWTIAGSPKWLNSINMSFWSWNQVKPEIDTLTAGSIDYSKALFQYTNDGQKDLLFAYNAEMRTFDDKTGVITGGSGSYNDSNDMDIKFYHALAAIRFDVSGLKKNNLTIKSITLSGVYSKGICNIAGDVNDRKVSFTWTDLSTAASFAQNYSASDFTETGLDGTTSAALMPMNSDKFLFFIPQAVKDMGIKIKIVFTDPSSNDITSEVALNHDPAWEAGKYYTYKLSAGAVDLALTGNSPAVNVKNTGSAKSYIRVAVVANWCLEDTSAPGTLYPLSECPASDLVFTGFNGTDDSYGGHWTLNTADGYYYYSIAVEPGWEVALFSGCTARTGAFHVNGTQFHLTVIGQAVAAGTATNWAGAATVSSN